MRGRTAGALGAAALAVAGCGASTSPTRTTGTTASAAGGLAWQGTPHVYRSRNLPRDRVAIGRVRNTGTETLHLIAAKLVLRDSAGRALKGAAAFTTTFAHGLYGALEQPAGGQPVAEQIRLGKIVYLPPGGSAPFYAAWRMAPGATTPVRVDYGSGTLAVPAPRGETAR